MDTDAGVGFPTSQAVKHGLWIITSPLSRNPGKVPPCCQEPMGVPVCCQRTPIKECPVGAVQTGRVAIPRLGEPQHFVVRDQTPFCAVGGRAATRAAPPPRRLALV